MNMDKIIYQAVQPFVRGIYLLKNCLLFQYSLFPHHAIYPAIKLSTNRTQKIISNTMCKL